MRKIHYDGRYRAATEYIIATFPLRRWQLRQLDKCREHWCDWCGDAFATYDLYDTKLDVVTYRLCGACRRDENRSTT